MNIKLKEEQKIKVSGPQDIYPIMQRILMRECKTDRDREHFWTISLDTASRILNIELVSMGTVNKTLVEPMEVLSIPLQKRAVKLILVHNHPSGQLIPSSDDKDLTDHLIQACRIMNIPVDDHLIITETSYYSFKDNGLLAELENSTKYVPQYLLKARYEKLGKEKGSEQGRNAKAREMARIMKKNGEPVEKIMEYTGLTKTAITNLKLEE